MHTSRRLMGQLLDLFREYGSSSLDYPKLIDRRNNMFETHCPPGLVVYQTHRQFNVLLGNPLCAVDHLPEVLHRFIVASGECGRKVIGIQVNLATASSLRDIDRQFHVNAFGQEAALRARDYPLDGIEGKAFADLRRSRNRVRRLIEAHEWEVMEQPELIECYQSAFGLDVPAARERVTIDRQRVAEIWRTRKENPQELRGIVHDASIQDDNDQGVRFLYIVQLATPSIVGFSSFSPIYSRGRVVSYYADVQRFLDEKKPHGQYDYLILDGLRRFQQSGVEEMSLGLVPLVNRHETDESHHPLVTFMLGLLLSEFGTDVMFNYFGLAKHKIQYYPVRSDIETYLVSHGNSFEVFRALLACMQIVGLLDQGIMQIAQRYLARVARGPQAAREKSS